MFLKDIRLERIHGDVFEIIPEWENAGASETVDMRSYFNRYLSDGGLPHGFSYIDIPGDRIVPLVLGPKSVSNTNFSELSESCLAQFNRRDDVNSFNVWGWAAYTSIFRDAQYFTRFCWDVRQVIFSDDRKSARLSHRLCGEGNCADRDCKPPPVGQTVTIKFAICKGPPVPPPQE